MWQFFFFKFFFFFFDLCSICLSSTYGPRGLWWHMPPLVLQHTLWQVWGVFLRVLWREWQQVPHRARMSECLQQRYIVILLLTYLLTNASYPFWGIGRCQDFSRPFYHVHSLYWLHYTGIAFYFMSRHLEIITKGNFE